ncbi:hypothetical protein ACNOYE_36490 [Nannocystaceae bacterium ST9]
MTHLSARSALAAGLLALVLLACNQQQSQDLPNRVLDRPTDLALTCARLYCQDEDGDAVVDESECVSQAGSLDLCAQDSGSCTTLPVYPTSEDENGEEVATGPATGDYHLFGFIANSERNEVAMFAQCANRLIDMTIETPGYNFVPAGVLPTNVEASADGCRVISSNIGSCDLSVLNAEGLAGFGLGIELAAAEPSSLVATLVPSRFDVESQRWLPIGARPAELLTVPDDLSTAPADQGELTGEQCDPGERGSVYVSFPTCNLVAEIDVQTGHVLQSRQFVSGDEGEVDVIDTGVSPICPVECPGQFEALPEDLPEIDQDGPFPQALELLRPIGNPVDQADEALDNQALFVGGLGSDSVFELRLAPNGEWTEDVQSLELQGASGVSRIRISPPVDFQDSAFGEIEFPPVPDRQFLYVIVGDGSTRVIARELEIGEGDPLGIECDTQRDPVAVEGAPDWACFPVTDADNVERRALVGGPGIRATNGADITDWTFIKVYEFPAESDRSQYTLFDQPGVFAVGTTTRGEVVYAMIDQTRVNGQTTVDDLTGGVVRDPLGLMRIELAPHSLWTDPSLTPVASLPAVRDTLAQRGFPADIGPSRVLAPSLRLIDYAYSSEERIAALLGDLVNRDLFGAGEDEDTPLYDEKVPRIAVHDYRSWSQNDWRLAWEGNLFSNAQATGRIACDTPGWEGGTCRVAEPDDARLHDSSAQFCDTGVLPGDKLILGGCAEDANCGDGRRCLRETAGGGDSTGICISAEAYEQSAADLRVICRDFIRDSCGEAHREYTITKAFQDELWIQSMDLPAISTLSQVGDPIEAGDELIPPDAPVVEVDERWVCSQEQPDGGCVDDDDCIELDDDGVVVPGSTGGSWQCIEERCRRPCEGPDECMLRPLPGPTCFGEFVNYQIAVRNSFLVTGPLTTLDRVDVDPETGECVPASDVETSQLLTSRIPLPPTSAADDPDWNAIPVCPTDEVLPTDPNPCRIQATSTDLRYHTVPYRDQSVPALRYSNPIFSIVLDLTSLESLTADVPDYDESTWPIDFAAFRRSRIPRGYVQEFSLGPGYQAFVDLVVLESRPVTLPMRIVASPESPVVFIVDGAGPGTSSGIRGQVVRVTLTDGDATVDDSFNGVR